MADLTAFYRIVGVSSSININRKNKRKKIKLKRILGLCQSNIFLPMHVHACALFFSSEGAIGLALSVSVRVSVCLSVCPSPFAQEGPAT